MVRSMTMQYPSTPPQILVQVGHIQATAEYLITPAGTWPLADVNINSADQTSMSTHTPGWAIAMVVIFIWFFFLSLLFLLARETRVAGFVAVHVKAGTQAYTDQIAIQNDAQRYDVMNRINYLQSLIGGARYQRQIGS